MATFQFPVILQLQRMSGELEEQADELLALSTILDDRAFNHTGTDPHKGSLEVQVKINYFFYPQH